MATDDRARYGAACACVIAFSLAYLVTGLLPVPLPIFDPGAGTWRVTSAPRPLEIRYYGQLLAGALAGSLALPLGAALARRTRPGAPLAALWAATAWGLAVALFVLANRPR